MICLQLISHERFGLAAEATRFARVCYEEAFKYLSNHQIVQDIPSHSSESVFCISRIIWIFTKCGERIFVKNCKNGKIATFEYKTGNLKCHDFHESSSFPVNLCLLC